MLAFVNEVAGGRRLLEALRERVDAGADSVAVAAPQNQPIVGQIVDRDEVRDAALSRVEVTQSVLAEFGVEASGAVMDPEPSAGARRCRPRLRAPRDPALVPVRGPLRTPAPRPGRVGEGPLRRPGDAHPGPCRRRRGALGRDPHPGGRNADDRKPRPDRAAEGARRRAAAPLHDDLPAVGRPDPRGRGRAPRAHARRDVPLRHRRDRPADEPGAVRRDRERDRALPDRRHPHLDARRAAVEVARAGPDRAGRGDHRQAGRALRGRRASPQSPQSAVRRERGGGA